MSIVVPFLIGSANDRSKTEPAVKIFKNFGIICQVIPMSAHRTPEAVRAFVQSLEGQDYRCILTGAGMSNGLSGMVAAYTTLPVHGIPFSGGGLDGLSALYSTVDMPPGIPVATFAIDGAANAALQVIRHLALDDEELDFNYRAFMARGSNVKAPMPDNVGKVCDTFLWQPEGCLPYRFSFVSDRLSAFDRINPRTVPNKGRVLANMTRHWLTKTSLAAIVSNHLADPFDEMPDWAKMLGDQLQITRNLPMLQLECIVRGYIVGSAWKEYQKSGTMHGEPMPEGMVQAQKLDEPTFTPSTKAEFGQHDKNINFKEACEIVGRESAVRARELSLALYKAGQTYAEERGIIILDTKFEFGIDPQTGGLVLADEVFTPDSSRFVDAATFVEGEEPESMDKPYARDWILSTGWDKDSEDPPPPLAPHVVAHTTWLYEEIHRRITGHELPDAWAA